jgi:hypothetical protein
LFKKQQIKFGNAVKVYAGFLSSLGESDKEKIYTIIKNYIENLPDLPKLFETSSSGESKEGNEA